jgi:glycosyltransferase involved in cell wall biosynthesis
LNTTRKDVVLVIAGNDDGYLEKLKAQVQTLDLDKEVLFTGFIQGKNKLAALKDADVLVLPSLYEYNSRVMYESILCGTPVIISDKTMTSESIKKIAGGYLFEHGNTRGLTALFNKVLLDKTETDKTVNKAADYIRANLSLDKVAERYEQLYLQVIEEAKRTHP